MSYKNLLVHVTDDAQGERRVALATKIAAAYGAHLVGLHITPPITLPVYVAAEVGPVVYEAGDRAAKKSAEQARGKYLEAVRQAGVNADWREDTGLANERLPMHVRYVDFAVVGQNDPESDAPPGFRDVAETTALEAGRPVLVVPYAGTFDDVGRDVLIAWNASREATRAINDALPFLQRAETVTVLSINPETGDGAHGDVPGADIALHLARHGVKADVTQAYGDDIDVGNLLLSRLSDLGVDMVVMGVYGKSRLREFVLGGASRSVMRHMTVPVFVSH